MRAIAEEAAALVRKFKGSYSGEHGDGLVRSEWIAPFYGPKLVGAFEEIKGIFDPRNLLNPGKIVHPSKQDDRALYRYKPDYQPIPLKTALDWIEWGGFDKAVEMCNNNGHCRKFDAGTMCPSYRVTREEQHLTRGRANTLRLALSGQLGADALASQEVYEALDLCVSCKGCKRECPTGVDIWPTITKKGIFFLTAVRICLSILRPVMSSSVLTPWFRRFLANFWAPFRASPKTTTYTSVVVGSFGISLCVVRKSVKVTSPMA
jgi:hypothetical protein